MKFINEYECTCLKEFLEEQQELRLHLKSKKISILKFKTSLHNLTESYTTLPEDVDLIDSLEIATELEEELEGSAVKLNIFLSKYEFSNIKKENPTVTTNFQILDLPLPNFYDEFQIL